MQSSFDAIVVGLGAMGSAAAYQLAKRGATVLGIDQFKPPHQLGSSHGETRVIRKAIGEGDAYVPLVLRAYELWHDLEQESGQDLLTYTGGYIICPKAGGANFHGQSDFASHTASLARKYGIDHKLCTAADVRQHAPAILMDNHEHAYYAPSDALLWPERCIKAQLDLAERNGATLHLDERVLDFSYDAQSVTVTTDRATYRGDKLIISAGAWMSNFLPVRLKPHVAVYRQLIYWFAADNPAQFHVDRFPWLIWIGAQPDDFFGVFPIVDAGTAGVKILTEQYDTTSQPDAVDRTVQPQEIADMYDRFVDRRLAGLSRNCLKAAVCLYTVTPDEGFIIDVHPDSDRVIVASPCSGHGFKHSTAIGEALSQMALNQPTTVDMSAFSFSRL